MSNPLVHAFFIGRALAETLGEQVEQTMTTVLSDLGKFDAEQREKLRQFTDEVMERAKRAEESSTSQSTEAGTVSESGAEPEDLQALLDELRAEIAQLRSEVQRYRNRSV